jgi:hypothetical protein
MTSTIGSGIASVYDVGYHRKASIEMTNYDDEMEKLGEIKEDLRQVSRWLADNAKLVQALYLAWDIDTRPHWRRWVGRVICSHVGHLWERERPDTSPYAPDPPDWYVRCALCHSVGWYVKEDED